MARVQCTMVVDHYTVLGVPHNATFDDIKRAYRIKAKLLHPDKAGPDSSEKMQQVNAAFEVLKDPQQRLMYDATCMADSADEATGEGFNWSQFNSFVNQVMQCVSAIAAARKQKRQQQADKKGPSVSSLVRVELRVTLAELWNPPVKKIAVRVARLPDTMTTKYLYVSLMNYQDEYVFEGEGDESEPGVFGDVRVALVVEPDDTFSIDSLFSRYDLHTSIKVTLRDYYYGADVPVTLPDGSKMEVAFQGLDGTGRCHVAHGRGLPFVDSETGAVKRGDLYVFFDVDLQAVDRAKLVLPEVRSTFDTLFG